MSDRKITVKVMRGSEDAPRWSEVDAWRTGVPGLVVNRAGGLLGWYVVSHVRSGRCFGPYVWPSIAAATRAAKKLGELEDWQDHYGQRRSITGRLLKQVVAACQEEGRRRDDVLFGMEAS